MIYGLLYEIIGKTKTIMHKHTHIPYILYKNNTHKHTYIHVYILDDEPAVLALRFRKQKYDHASSNHHFEQGIIVDCHQALVEMEDNT